MLHVEQTLEEIQHAVAGVLVVDPSDQLEVETLTRYARDGLQLLGHLRDGKGFFGCDLAEFAGHAAPLRIARHRSIATARVIQGSGGSVRPPCGHRNAPAGQRAMAARRQVPEDRPAYCTNSPV